MFFTFFMSQPVFMRVWSCQPNFAGFWVSTLILHVFCVLTRKIGQFYKLKRIFNNHGPNNIGQWWAGEPNSIGPCCQQNSIVVGCAPPGPSNSRSCCQQNLIALARSVSFKIQACNCLGVNWLTCRDNPSFKLIWQKPNRIFFFFKCVFSHTQRPFFSYFLVGY